jgi:hypothetical protein
MLKNLLTFFFIFGVKIFIASLFFYVGDPVPGTLPEKINEYLFSVVDPVSELVGLAYPKNGMIFIHPGSEKFEPIY